MRAISKMVLVFFADSQSNDYFFGSIIPKITYCRCVKNTIYSNNCITLSDGILIKFTDGDKVFTTLNLIK